MRRIYLDNNATTRTDPAVVEAMLPFFTAHFGNASSPHAYGEPVAAAVRRARQQVQALVGAAFEHEIVFTSSGTEADNAALRSGVAALPGRDELVVSAVEHPAVMSVARALEAAGTTVRYVGVDAKGRIDLAAYCAALTPRTALASVMWANNETGTVFPVAALAEIAHAAGALFHTDAVQAAGRLELDVSAAGVDMLSLSAHKLHGPKGIGALYVRKGTPFAPLILGGPQERRRRAGTENAPGIVGFGAAAEIARARLDADAAHMNVLRDRFEARARQLGAVALGDPQARLPNTASLGFAGLDGEALLHGLDRLGVAASLGSACASGAMAPSHVLIAMGVAPDLIRGVLRFSLSRETSPQDIEAALAGLSETLARLRARAIPELAT